MRSSISPRAVVSSFLVLLLLLPLAAAALIQSEDPEGAARRLLLESQRALERGDLDAAIAELTTVVERLPDSGLRPEALLRIARLWADAGRTDEALATLERLEQDHGASPEAAAGAVLEARLQLARANERADLERLRSDLRRIATLFPADHFPRLVARAEARVLAARIALLLGSPDDAASDFVAVIEDEPPSSWSARARLGFAEVLVRQGRWQLAADELQRLRLESATTGGGSDESAEIAARRLTLIDRLQLRPQIGDRSWSRATALAAERLPEERVVSLAASDAGALLLTEERRDVAWLLPAGSQVATELPVPAGARAHFDSEGRPWFTFDEGLQAPDGTRLLSFRRPDGKERPLSKIVGGARNGLGDWLLIDRDLSGVGVYDAQGRPSGLLAEGISSEPVDLAADGRGGAWVLDRRDGRLVRIGLERQVETSASLAARRPVAIDVDPFGNLYVLDAAGPAVLVLSPRGELRQRIAGALLEAVELQRPVDLAVDGSGRIFLLDGRSGRVVILE